MEHYHHLETHETCSLGPHPDFLKQDKHLPRITESSPWPSVRKDERPRAVTYLSAILPSSSCMPNPVLHSHRTRICSDGQFAAPVSFVQFNSFVSIAGTYVCMCVQFLFYVYVYFEGMCVWCPRSWKRPLDPLGLGLELLELWAATRVLGTSPGPLLGIPGYFSILDSFSPMKWVYEISAF